MYVQRNNEEPSRQHCCRGEAIGILYSERVYAAVFIQHTKRMHRTLLSSVVCIAVHHFSTISHKTAQFSEKSYLIKYLFCVPLQFLSEIYLIIRITQRDVIRNRHRY
jgi:hypothetical protein